MMKGWEAEVKVSKRLHFKMQSPDARLLGFTTVAP